jgi:hypothetical protein
MAGAAAGAAFSIELMGELDTVVSTAARASDFAALDDDELAAVVLGLEAGQSKFDAARACAVAELDARSVTEDQWGSRTGGFIAHETHTPTRAATRRVSLSRRLRDEFPVLGQALADGVVAWSHVEAFCQQANPRIAGLLGLLLPELIDLATDSSFFGWATELRRIAVRLDIDGGHNPTGDVTANKVFLSASFDGTYELRGRFVGVLGASLAEMWEKETDRQYRYFKQLAELTNGETEVPPRATLRALAMVELFRKGTANSLADTNAPVTDLTITHHHGADHHSPDQEPAVSDGNVSDESCDGVGDHVGCGDMCDHPGDEFTDELSDLLDGLPANRHRDGRCARDGCRSTACEDEYTTLDGTILSAAELGCMICDPAISLLRFSGDNAVLNLQRTQRFANRDQRRALNGRDGGCIFPGCDCPASWTDKHHVDLFEHGGPTDLRNFASLCRFHHGVTHRRGWSMTANGDGTFTWTTPQGRTLHSQSHTTRTRGSPQLALR